MGVVRMRWSSEEVGVGGGNTCSSQPVLLFLNLLVIGAWLGRGCLLSCHTYMYIGTLSHVHSVDVHGCGCKTFQARKKLHVMCTM